MSDPMLVRGRRAGATALVIRQASLDDVDAIHAVVESAYRDQSAAGWTTEATILAGTRTRDEDIIAQITGPDSLMLVACKADDEQTILGTCHIENRGDFGYFGMFAVDPKAQSLGIGRSLSDAAEQIVTGRWGLDRMRMCVIAQRLDLIAWYESNGYVRTGGTEPFPGGETSTPLVDEIHMVHLEKPLS